MGDLLLLKSLPSNLCIPIKNIFSNQMDEFNCGDGKQKWASTPREPG